MHVVRTACVPWLANKVEFILPIDDRSGFLYILFYELSKTLHPPSRMADLIVIRGLYINIFNTVDYTSFLFFFVLNF